jgi:hypothetical protein
MPALTRRGVLRLATATGLERFVGGSLVMQIFGCARAPPIRWRGVDVSSAQTIVLEAGDLPPAMTFTGKYRSPHTPHLELLQQGALLSGRYGDAEGEWRGLISGRIAGNLAQFRWSESRLPGDAPEPLKGTGYFFFDPPASPEAVARLFGWRTFSIGRWPSEATRDGGPWTAVRLPK